MRNNRIEMLLECLHKPKPWDDHPVFCFTTDIDWASEAILSKFFQDMLSFNLRLTAFVTHESATINKLYSNGIISRGIHPNFLNGSSHGNDFRSVIETCIKYAPESHIFRSHRFFDVTDITHLLHDEYHYKYSSNYGTMFQRGIGPVLHESGLINFPVFFEDGTYLFNGMNTNIKVYEKYLTTPGIKVISIHPSNYVLNPPTLGYMRSIKDTLTREEYNMMTAEQVNHYSNTSGGIRDVCKDLISLAQKHTILSLEEIYELAIN